jgi:hypothetical protein
MAGRQQSVIDEADPRVATRVGPDGHAEAPTRSEDTSCLRKGRRRRQREHEAPPADDPVHAGVGQVDREHVEDADIDVLRASRLDEEPGRRHALRPEVRADRATGGPDELGQLDAHRADAARELEDGVARPDADPLQQPPLEVVANEAPTLFDFTRPQLIALGGAVGVHAQTHL